MSNNSLGNAYVQIVPVATGITKKMDTVLAPGAASAGQLAGATISRNISTGLQKVGGAMTTFITKPALAAATILGGATIFSGWKRMTEIDNAKVKLQAIGNSAKDVQTITQNALEAVKGTAYGMDAAMTASASAVAAGIKPGKQLETYLKAISDAAAVAGVDMNEMGYIFNSVATKGKVSNKELKEMAQRGIPVYQYLSKELGVTADKVFELAKKGEISLSDFQNAVSKNIGGAAKEIGSKTITGAISNLKASISRIGANFLGSADDANSFAGKILPLLNKLMESLAPIEEKAKELGAKMADAFTKIVNALSKIPLPVLAKLGAALVGIGPILLTIGRAMPVIQTALAAIPAPLAGILGPITAIAAVLILAYTRSETFRNAINTLVIAVVSKLGPAIKAGGQFFKVFVKEVMSVAKAIGDALAPVIKLVTPLVSFLAKVFSTKLIVVFRLAAAEIKALGALIKTIAAIIQGVAQGLAVPLEKAAGLIKGAVKTIKGLFPLKLGKIFSGIKLPHFKISGGKIPWGIGGKGEKPKVDIEWYKKGGIFDSPSIIGVGEAGREAVLPLQGRQMRPFAEAIASELNGHGGTTYNIGDIKLSMDDLKDIVTLEQFVEVVKRAKAFA